VTTLFLCRHAAAADAEQRLALAGRLSTPRVAAVYTSPLVRAVKTARAVARVHQLAPIEVAALREIDLGEVNGLEFDEFPSELQQGLLHEPWQVRFPGGETYAELQLRVCAAVDRIVAAHPGERVVVISHAGSIRAALARWLMMDDDAIFRIDQRHASLNVVDWFDGVPLVRLVNGPGLSG
jgi:broad specificity phosphatase PhoE